MALATVFRTTWCNHEGAQAFSAARNYRCIRMRRKPDDGVKRNPSRTGNQYTDRDINWAPGYGPVADAPLPKNGQGDTSVDARAEAMIRRMEEENRRLRE
jgi:hypothetical protein